MSTELTEALFGYQEVCDFMHLSRSTIRKRIESGEFPPPMSAESNEKRRWRKTDIENFIQYGRWSAVPKRKKMPR